MKNVAQLAHDGFSCAHWASLNKPHLHYADIEPVIETLAQHPDIHHTLLGHSFAGRPIHRLSIGSGSMAVLAWTQMHGDEATATGAVLDWLAYLTQNEDTGLPADWQQQLSLHIIPMLNPDGAQQCTRYNAQGIDINRDALGLQTPEGRILMAQAAQLKPVVAFNLHDQNAYYGVGEQPHPSTIAFLAPAFNVHKQIDTARHRAKQLIAHMRASLLTWLPEEVARYDDTYSKRCFGDNIAALEISTILIESGAYWQDPNRQMARKMNMVALHSALAALLSNDYSQYDLADYYAIAENREDAFCDLKLNQLCVPASPAYLCDLAINIDRHSGDGRIAGLGDLCVMHGFTELPPAQWQLLPRRGLALMEPVQLSEQRYRQLLSQGVCYFYGNPALLDNQTDWPTLIVPEPLREQLMPNDPAYLVLTGQNEKSCLAILNGRCINLS